MSLIQSVSQLGPRLTEAQAEKFRLRQPIIQPNDFFRGCKLFAADFEARTLTRVEVMDHTFVGTGITIPVPVAEGGRAVSASKLLKPDHTPFELEQAYPPSVWVRRTSEIHILPDGTIAFQRATKGHHGRSAVTLLFSPSFELLNAGALAHYEYAGKVREGSFDTGKMVFGVATEHFYRDGISVRADIYGKPEGTIDAIASLKGAVFGLFGEPPNDIPSRAYKVVVPHQVEAQVA